MSENILEKIIKNKIEKIDILKKSISLDSLKDRINEKDDDKLEIKLLEINKEKRRLYCGLKQLKENPWDDITKNYIVGDAFETQIVNKVDFGIFVKIFDEIDGMVHISDLSWNEKESNSILNSLKKGDKIKVKILEIDASKERVSLSVKHLTDDPVQNYISQNPVKSIVSGKIISVNEKYLC